MSSHGASFNVGKVRLASGLFLLYGQSRAQFRLVKA